jgi:hypothetical protein
MNTKLSLTPGVRMGWCNCWSVGLGVVNTDFRHAPLHHFVVPVAGQGMYNVRQSDTVLCDE